MKQLVLAVMALFAACATPPESGVLSQDIFEDLPAPKGAQYRVEENQSFSYRGREFRCGKFVYDFAGSQKEAVSFFESTMTAPPYSWTLEKKQRAAVESTYLVFTKGDDRCMVEIDRKRNAGQTHDKVTIEVRLNYRG